MTMLRYLILTRLLLLTQKQRKLVMQLMLCLIIPNLTTLKLLIVLLLNQ